MNNGYVVGGSVSTGTTPSTDTPDGYWSLSRCKKAYLDYLGNKTNEVEEQKEARRYYHASQWTAKQIKILNDRKQPVVTFNRIGRKIDGVVGLLERLRQDPKAYPRTPQHEQGAELATAVVRYVLDEQDWKSKSPECARDGAIDGIAGIELEIIDGDQGDKEVGFEIVEPDSFFYDPRSYRMDFSDARYMGLGKWVDVEVACELFPDKEADIRASLESGTDLTSNSDRDNKWFSTDETSKRIRLVDIWYQHKSKWCYTIFTGSVKLMEGESYLFDEKKKTICKYIMFSGNIDHDGDRYGFIRNMKSAQDEYNSRRSVSLHTLGTKRIFITEGSVADIEKTRREAVRKDGIVTIQGSDINSALKIDDQSFDFAGQMKLMENAIAELENYGPNQALIGDVQNQSGRAISLLQQAGMAELGPYIMSNRGWKIRVYRALLCAAQRHWTAERWIRVTDDDGVKQFIQINGVQIDPQTGQPTMVNAIGSLDVDIIMDEGADSINAQADLYETFSKILPSVAPMLSPQQAQAALGILVESSALPGSAKKKFSDASQQQPDPAAEQAKQIAMQGEAAKVGETQSKTELNKAKVLEIMNPQPQVGAAPKPEKYELPPEIQNAQALADIGHKQAQAYHITTQAELAPVKLAHESAHKTADRDQRDEQFQPAEPA